MPWAPRGDADPALTTKSWRKLRLYWKAQRLPCSLCGRMIDYDGPRYFVVGGRRKINKRYLVVGHITSRHEARRLGWAESEINSLLNTRPECMDCSNRSGAKLGRRIQDGPWRKPVKPTKPTRRTAPRW